MKEIALKPVIMMPLPPETDPIIAQSLQRAETAIRENNALIEQVLNTLIKEYNNATDSVS